MPKYVYKLKTSTKNFNKALNLLVKVNTDEDTPLDFITLFNEEKIGNNVILYDMNENFISYINIEDVKLREYGNIHKEVQKIYNITEEELTKQLVEETEGRFDGEPSTYVLLIYFTFYQWPKRSAV